MRHSLCLHSLPPPTTRYMPRCFLAPFSCLGLFVWLLMAALVVADQPPADYASQPLSPDEALGTLQVPDELIVELVAAEPDVMDPVAIRFDEHGRMWVVEMGDYPHGPSEGEDPMSRIRVLEDRDGDGRYETATTFADKLLFVTGLQPWKGGVIVTLAGRVAFMKDTDGDGRCDVEETWFVGFAEENSQLRANRPTLAVDNHVYIANGLRGGEVRDARQPAPEIVSIRSMDFRFDPLGTSYEAVSGFGQFGLTFDAYGRRFECSNRNPLRHVVIEDRYIRANPAVSIPDTGWDVAAHGENSKLYPRSRAWTTSTLHAGQFTAACGVQIYRGTLLPREYQGAAFTCDPTGNLVHCEILKPYGATFKSTPLAEGVEFLSSTDEWFRPVNVEVGPEGALYIVDMYRAVIEHPQFMPDELKNRPDLRYGIDRGRIYRIRPRDAALPAVQDLASLNDGELVELLDSDVAWQRETAHRLLLEREATGVAAELRRVSRNGERSTARIHALWLLEGFKQLTPEDVAHALTDAAAEVREHGCVLSERWPEDSALRGKLLGLATDPDPRVRFQVALSSAPLRRADEVAALAAIALAGADDTWTRQAVALAGGPFAAELAAEVLKGAQEASAVSSQRAEVHVELLEQSYAAAAGLDSTGPELLQTVFQLSPADHLARAAVLGSLRGWAQRRADIGAFLAAVRETHSEGWERLLERAQEDVLNDELSEPLRRTSIELLARAGQAAPVVELALNEDALQPLRIAAIQWAPRFADRDVWQQIFEQFPAAAPAVRSAMTNAALNYVVACEVLLDEIAAGRIKPQELGRLEANRLLQHGNAEIRQRANELFAAATPEERRQALARYQQSLTLEADPQRGREIFAKNCATCHRIGDLGVDVAPDIADSRTKTPQQLLTDILQPNQAIDGNYVAYIVQTEDGRTFTGILSGETTTSITLKLPEGKTLTLPREEIALIRSTGVSLMPEGLEQDITLEQMADLISFIKNWRYLDGRTPLGE